MQDPKTKKSGGTRPGSGRPKTGAKRAFTVYFPPALLAKLKEKYGSELQYILIEKIKTLI
jgi:hypothetical protein